jgi:CRISPR-associated endonuclease/helicase Cas3
MNDDLNFFCHAFSVLTDQPAPFGWQKRLYQQMLTGDLPSVCNLPTGLGKTMVIPIWLIALAKQSGGESDKRVPRRLIYIVNRRTVVDQATSVVEQIRQRLLDPDGPNLSAQKVALRTVAESLKRLASTEDMSLAVSTLRGELADNEEWKADPARPAIVIGTIDMVGSKLLFSGYGDGRYWRAQHAGLIGHDSLIVHDEAHLSPAFSELLHRLTEVQAQCHEPRPLRVMELSATSRRSTGPVLKLEPQDEEDQVTGRVVKDRLDAEKILYIHQPQIGPGDRRADIVKKAAEKLVELSIQHRDAKAKVLIYVRSPEEAQEVIRLLSRKLGKDADHRIALLTGTIRGHERDRLMRENPVYRALLNPNASVKEAVFLVSTSAGEVGIDIDADHMVCDLTTLDSLIQRLGRVNRRGGEGRDARVDVVVKLEEPDKQETPSEVDAAVKETLVILEGWAAQSRGAIDVSPRTLCALVDSLGKQRRETAFTPRPAAPPLSDILLDAWSLTSITGEMPGRPEVASYLHGLEKDVPETYVAWRKEVTLLHEAGTDHDVLSDWFQACRIEARERLRDRTDRVKKTAEALLKEHRKKGKDETLDFPVVVLNERGEAQWSSLSRITRDNFILAYRTVVLPVEAGGLNAQGTLDAKEICEASDVAEEGGSDGAQRERWLEIEGEDGLRYERLLTRDGVKTLPHDFTEREHTTLREAAEDTGQGGRYLILMTEPRHLTLDHAETAKLRQPLDFHLNLAAGRMKYITSALGLDESLEEALELAAEWHDRGKSRPVWQRYACNSDLAISLAKSTRYLHGRFLGGYRHEFGSLLDAAANDKIRGHPGADLILHLIAAHHGWARPHFERHAWDTTHTTAENEEGTAEVMRRFARLQRRFGRWGLAWLESLVRCADIAASGPSAPPPAVPTETEVNE